MRVLLVGFMGAGKTSVGRRLAEGLGWRFLDFDDVIAAETGTTIADIFRSRGEAQFRALEADAARRLLAEEHVVLGSGGGWGGVPGRLRGLPPGTATFWLRVSPRTAVERAAREPGGRPLLAFSDPAARAAELVAERAPHYAEARWAVDTEGSTVDDVAARILQTLARQYPGVATE